MANLDALNHWMLHDDLLARQFDDILRLSPGYNPVRQYDTHLTFYASLLSSPKPILGPDPVFARPSAAMYQSPAAGWIDTSVEHQSRPEYGRSGAPLGTLLEPASVNKILCGDNANPIEIIGMSLSGDPAATIEIVNDYDALHAAGLTKRCRGSAVLFRNPGTAAAWVNLDTQDVNVVPHVASAYIRGNGRGLANLTGGSTGEFIDLPAEYTREWIVETPDQANRKAQIRLAPNSSVYFVLWDLQESLVLQSPIEQSAVGVVPRAVETLEYPLLSGDIVSDVEGMAVMRYRPGFSRDEIPDTLTDIPIWQLGSVDSRLFGYQKLAAESEVLYTKHNGRQSNVSIPGGLRRQTYTFAITWASATTVMDLGIKVDGAWQWSQLFGFGGWGQGAAMQISPFVGDLALPSHSSLLAIWNKNRGLQWIQARF